MSRATKSSMPMAYRAIFFALQLLLVTTASADIDIKIKTLQRLQALPDIHPLLLEERQRVDGCEGKEKNKEGHCLHEAEIAILDIQNGQEFAWDLPINVIGPFEPGSLPGWPECAGISNAQMKSWALDAEKLLYARCGAAFLISRDGSAEILQPQMPGYLNKFSSMAQYAISANAKRYSYSIYVRDIKDRQPDGFGRLYRDLMIQEIGGSVPVSLSKESTTSYVSAISPDGSRIAYHSEDKRAIKIISATGETISTINVAETNPFSNTPEDSQIREMRWSPDGTKLAVIKNTQLYISTLTGAEPTLERIHPELAYVANLAWSPDGQQIAFRSSYENEQTCSYGPGFSGGVISWKRCADGYRLYSVDIASGKINRLKASTEYRPQQLFWIK